MFRRSEKISVAMCTYNGEGYLGEQIHSLLEQTKLPDELVVCDDSSRDCTFEILLDFQRSAPFDVRLYSNEQNLGYVKNFEQAILRCSGSIILPADQDDVWKPEKIETVVGVFESRPETHMVVTNAALVDAANVPIGASLWEVFGFSRDEISSLSKNALDTLLFGTNFISGNTTAVRSELCSKLTSYPVPPGSAHDHWLGVIAALTGGLAVLDFESINYRQHDTQIFGARKRSDHLYLSSGQAKQRFIRIVETANAQADSYEGLLRILENPEKHIKASPLFPEVDEMRVKLDSKISQLRGQAAHYSLRSGYGKNRVRRVTQILQQLKDGSYSQYSSGFKSALFDLFRK